MIETTCIICNICNTIIITTAIICVTRMILSWIDKCHQKKIIFDERERKYNWEEKIFNRNEEVRKRNEAIEDKERATREEKDKERAIREEKDKEEKNKDAMQAKIDSLEAEIASLKERKAIASILISKLGEVSKDDFKKEKERISGLLDEIQ